MLAAYSAACPSTHETNLSSTLCHSLGRRHPAASGGWRTEHGAAGDAGCTVA